MFRGAVRGDLPQILQIYAHAREAMAASGNPTQWGDNFPPQELLEEDIDSNRLFVYVVNGQLMGVFAFILGVDPTYQVIEDGAWLNDALPYGTIHRLASSGKSKGVASAVIEWCLEHCQICGQIPMPTTRSCSICWKRTALRAAASSCGGRNAPHRLPEAGPDPAAQLSQKHSIAPFAPRVRPRGRGCFFCRQNCKTVFYTNTVFGAKK